MKILFSQNAPSNLAPYEVLQKKFGAKLDFHPFFLVEPLSEKEFRARKINFPDYTAIVFSSRHAIDAYFKLAEETRFRVPDTMKYFCTTEAVAMYLQKHTVYRKRKIFFGDGTPASVVNLVGAKHKEEKFLIVTSVGSNSESMTSLFDKAGLEYSEGQLVKSVTQDLHALNLHSYDMIVLYNPSDIKSLQENFPEFEQENIKFVSFGKSIVNAMENAGYRIEVKAPSPEASSAAKAIELYLQSRK